MVMIDHSAIRAQAARSYTLSAALIARLTSPIASITSTPVMPSLASAAAFEAGRCANPSGAR